MIIDRHTPYKFKNGLVMKNRVIVPPMASRTADESGFVTDQTIEHYKRLGRSNAGLIFVEYSYIHQTGKGEANQLGAGSNAHIPGLKQIASIIHQTSAVAGLQLVHVGGKTSTDLTRTPLMGPSATPVPVKDRALDTPVPMTEAQIQNWQEWFVEAVGRAVAADFDFVELHAAHGYGLNQWLSPLTNKRTDSFGGTIEGRSRLLLRIATKIKATYPKILLSVRLPAQDYLDGGLTVSEMAWVVSQLESIGVDLIDVSSGIGGWRRPEGSFGQGYLVADATQLKTQTAVPVMGVGGIETGEFIDEILRNAHVDFAAVGRAILQDPESWGRKNLNLLPDNVS
ncbi:MAG: NADH:flavin oxidoreductase [Bdellovibrionaceae bacterium]|nr:NADH:flavin oxidoreductase [Pseudobdellovibrionaceae bacterium]